ncbi:MAG: hypothetical protein LKK25_00060 [Sphaerochaeta sp.]|jgi:ABC-2 type transport system permease protein|nr:hypothetical protein [Sphaerochaeta sp.]
MGEAVFLLRAYLKGTRPLDQVLGGSSKKWVRALTLAALIYGFGVLAVMLGFSYQSYQEAGRMVGHPEWGYAMALLFSFIFSFFTFLFSVPPLLYTSRDMPLVMTLPLSTRSVFFSRFLIAWLSMLVLDTVMLLPALVVWILHGGAAPLAILSFLGAVVGESLATLSLVFLVSMVMVRLTRGIVSPWLGKVGFTIAILAVTLLGARGMTRQLDGTVDLSVIAQRLEAVVDNVPLFATLARSLWEPLWVMVVWVGLPLFAWVLLSLSTRLFPGNYSLAQRSQGGKATRRAARNIPPRSVVSALEKRERMIIRSQSVFQMEIYAQTVIPLILLGVFAVTGAVGEMTSSLAELKTVPRLPQILLIVFSLFPSLSTVSSTSVSREGALFDLDRTYPVEAGQFVQAKIRTHLRYLGVSTELFVIVTLCWLGLPIWHFLWMAPMLLLVSVASAAIGLAIDYHRPNLSWTLPQQAMKSNINAMLAMIPSLALVAVLALVMLALPLPVAIVLGCMMLATIAWGSYRIAVRQAASLLKGA